MADIQRTTNIGSTCNRQNLYDLLDQSNLINVTTDDVASGVALPVSITAASEAPTFSTDLWWFDQTDQLLKIPLTDVGGSPASCYLAVGPDSWHYPGFNVASDTIRKGELLRFSYSPGAGIYDITPMEPVTTNVTSNACLRCWPQLRNMYGIAGTTIAPGEFGPVVCKGFAHAIVDFETWYERTGTYTNRYTQVLHPSTQYTGTFASIPVGELTTDFADTVALGLTNPEATGVSVLGPVFCEFPAGRRHSQQG